jgi:hypothetical protein
MLMRRRNSGNGHTFDPNASLREGAALASLPTALDLGVLAAVGRVEHLKAVDLVKGRA